MAPGRRRAARRPPQRPPDAAPARAGPAPRDSAGQRLPLCQPRAAGCAQGASLCAGPRAPLTPAPRRPPPLFAPGVCTGHPLFVRDMSMGSRLSISGSKCVAARTPQLQPAARALLPSRTASICARAPRPAPDRRPWQVDRLVRHGGRRVAVRRERRREADGGRPVRAAAAARAAHRRGGGGAAGPDALQAAAGPHSCAPRPKARPRCSARLTARAQPRGR